MFRACGRTYGRWRWRYRLLSEMEQDASTICELLMPLPRRLSVEVQDTPQLIDLSMILRVLHPVEPGDPDFVATDLIQNLSTILGELTTRCGIAMPKSRDHLGKKTLRTNSEYRPLEVFRRSGGDAEIGMHLKSFVELSVLVCIDWKGI